MSAADNACAARETVLRLVDEALTDLRSWGGANSVMHTKLTAIRYAAVRMPVPAAAPSSGAAQPDEARAREWLQANVLVPERYRDEWVATLGALIADVRRETIDACAKAAETDPHGYHSDRTEDVVNRVRDLLKGGHDGR